VKGLSGCEVTLFPRCVLKEGGDRLVKQSHKQKAYSENTPINGLKIPKVYEIKDRYTIMERVYGEPLLSVIEDLSLPQVFSIADRIISFISRCKGMVVPSDDFGSATAKKIKVKAPDVLYELSPCHGDLTLENLMYDETTDTLWMIDLLDSYHEHYFLDIVAPLQNSKVKFHNPDAYGDYNLEVFNLYYERMVDKVFPEVIPWKDYLLYAKMKRIKPYVDKNRKGWLDEWLKNNRP
jgi:hypothetical protein